MNKTLIALAVSAAAVATGAYADGINQSGDKAGSTVYSAKGTSLEVGGRAEARLSLKDGKAQDNSRVRLNFLVKQKSMTAYTVLVSTKASLLLMIKVKTRLTTA